MNIKKRTNMKTQRHPIDDLFRKSLGDISVRPSEERRSALLDDLDARVATRRRRGRWLTGIGLILIAGMLATGVYLLQDDSPDHSKVTQGNSINELHALPSDISSREPLSSGKDETLPEDELPAFTQPGSTQPKSVINTSSSEINQISAETEYISIETQSIVSENNVHILTIPTIPTGLLQLSGQAEPDLNLKIFIHPVPEAPTKKAKQPRRSLAIKPGAWYTPEWMFNTLDGNKFVNNFGLEGTLSFGPYSVRTGAGLSITRGSNETAVTTQEYIGTYKLLDSITFKWDPVHYEMLPTYFFTPTELFDTTSHLYYYSMIREYTYLQVPLILGYDFVRGNRFSAGFRVGPILSVLLKTTNLTPAYDPGRDKIILVNNITPERISLNWQLMGGINFSYRLYKQWSLNLEPEFRYYFNSVYEKSGFSTKPWSVGIRTAIIYEF